MSEKTNEILTNYFLQKQAKAPFKMKLKHALRRGGIKAQRFGQSAAEAGKALDESVVGATKTVGSKLNAYGYKGAPGAAEVNDLPFLKRMEAKLGRNIMRHPRAYGYSTLGGGIALGVGANALAGKAVYDAVTKDDSIVGQGLGLAKDNPLAAAGIGAGAGALTAGSIAYALAPEKAKKLAALIAGAAGAAAAGAGTYYGLKNA